ncbi:MAG: hypothetical protein GY813_12230, partial [Halieaceae bacterium]|nr:hypothetical protein [Halieaceae bacterium]
MLLDKQKYYVDPVSNERESTAMMEKRWTLFGELQKATPYHKHVIVTLGNCYELLSALLTGMHFTKRSAYHNVMKLHALHLKFPKPGIQGVINTCREVSMHAEAIGAEHTVPDQLLVGAILEACDEGAFRATVNELQNRQTLTFLECCTELLKRERDVNTQHEARLLRAPRQPRQQPQPRKAMLTSGQETAPRKEARAPRTKSKEACKRFQQGRCTKGDKCKYQHVGVDTDSKSNTPKPKSTSPNTPNNIKCYLCGGPHYARDCTKKRVNLAVTSADAKALLEHKHCVNVMWPARPVGIPPLREEVPRDEEPQQEAQQQPEAAAAAAPPAPAP